MSGKDIFSADAAADMSVGEIREALKEKVGVEMRLARDGKFYTAEEFSGWYTATYGTHSEERCQHAWESAYSLKPASSLLLLLPNGVKLDSSHDDRSILSVINDHDKVSLGDMIQHNPQVKARMGCHSNENNLFFTQKANGIMGIGPSSLSGEGILEKIFKDREHVSHKVFSICLAEWGGQFNVGGYDTSYHTGRLQRIPLNPGGFYGVGLSAMKVNGQTITSWGSTMIDSGTTYTYMRSSNYRALSSAIESYCSGPAEAADLPRPKPASGKDGWLNTDGG
ncbi:unnamed protein product [Effrenium voratum]|nr:unnamed protein product [Effrenium voratum]